MTFKKLLMTAVLLTAVCFNFYSQSSEQADSSVQTELSSFENNTNYFNNSPSANAPAQVRNQNGSGIGLFIRMVFVLAFVIALIYGLLWFIKNKTNVVKTDDEFLRRAAYINIAPGKSVEVITLVDRAYVIGVTEDGITLLGEIDSKSDEQTAQMINAMNLRADQTQNTKKPLNFTDVMDMFLAKKGKVKNVFSDTENQVDQIFSRNKSENGENNEES
ncbi:Flagellar biogenesis protein [Treponema sp. JC4]|uniref:FliO/MopB family protein n=1 Tax=Treponema sp. JC4 TaxID=1124982 RepID=UPI00025B0ACC|nr:flagellar biosynthetic protein FliO [Treponema sp. JC4]EID84646.1 Flagellar biogenesis protein [Treponema sp. JC4]